jgi:hypothetical protein
MLRMLYPKPPSTHIGERLSNRNDLLGWAPRWTWSPLDGRRKDGALRCLQKGTGASPSETFFPYKISATHKGHLAAMCLKKVRSKVCPWQEKNISGYCPLPWKKAVKFLCKKVSHKGNTFEAIGLRLAKASEVRGGLLTWAESPPISTK